MTTDSADATVVIATRNRKDELRNAVRSVLEQDAHPHIIVIDDGSTDGTSEMIRTEFPTVHLDRVDQPLGYIVQRNRGAAMAKTPFIVSIDDDAIFTTPHVVSQTLAEFDDARIAAVGIPFIDVNKNGRPRSGPAPSGDVAYIMSTYVGTAHALRRELFLKLGGYRGFLFRQGEEDDYCIRMLAAGYFVRMGRADPIHHFESPKRDFRLQDIYSRRNNVLYIWCNVPLAYLPLRLLGTTVNMIRSAWKTPRRFPQMALGLLQGCREIFKYWAQRKPVPVNCYRLNRRLLREKLAPLSSIEPDWPPTLIDI